MMQPGEIRAMGEEIYVGFYELGECACCGNPCALCKLCGVELETQMVYFEPMLLEHMLSHATGAN